MLRDLASTCSLARHSVTAVLFVRPIRYFFCALLRQMAEKSLKELIATKLKLKSVEEELKQVLRPSTHTTAALTTHPL